MRRADQVEVEMPRRPRLALDKRTVSRDGFLTVDGCTISAAQVNDYLGSEVVDWQALGLDPQKLYRVYRDALELKKAVPLFNGIPLLIEHAAVNASDLKQQLIVGTVSDCEWSNGRVVGTVSVWLDRAIQGIESAMRKDLSAGYGYKPAMGPGTTSDGQHWDLRMTDIRPQHVALVAQGRVSGAQVAADAMPSHVALARIVPGYGRLR